MQCILFLKVMLSCFESYIYLIFVLYRRRAPCYFVQFCPRTIWSGHRGLSGRRQSHDNYYTSTSFYARKLRLGATHVSRPTGGHALWNRPHVSQCCHTRRWQLDRTNVWCSNDGCTRRNVSNWERRSHVRFPLRRRSVKNAIADQQLLRVTNGCFTR